jgi:hypothetical protein
MRILNARLVAVTAVAAAAAALLALFMIDGRVRADSAQGDIPTIEIETPNGPLEVADPQPYVSSDSVRYATSADGFAYLTAAGTEQGRTCLIAAPLAGASGAGQLGCDSEQARAAGTIWMSTEIGASGQVGALLVPAGTASATVNGTPEKVEGEVLAFAGARGVPLEVEARDGGGRILLRTTIPASVGDLSGGEVRPSPVQSPDIIPNQ